METIFGLRNKSSLQSNAQPSETRTGTMLGTQRKNSLQPNALPSETRTTQTHVPKSVIIFWSPNQNSLQPSAQPSFRARGANGAKTNSQHGGRYVCKLWELITTHRAAELPRARCTREADEAANGASVAHSV